MLRGSYGDAFSADGYVTLPARDRAAFAQGAVVLLPLMAANELWIYPLADAPPARAVRYAAKAVLRLDAEGRILLPRAMRALAVANELRRLVGAGACFTLRSADPIAARARRRGLNPRFAERKRTRLTG
jgi:DNA-binding transcriptional regulator/RsmH inhibitor MraZ